MKKILWILLTGALLISSCTKDEENASIVGVLKTETGEILAFSTVLLKSNDITVQQTQTDDVGAFEFVDINLGNYTLIGENDKYKTSKEVEIYLSKGGVMEYEFIFEPRKSIIGTVMYSGTTFVPAATVELYDNPKINILEKTQTDLEGGFIFYDLEPGIYHLEAFTDDWVSTVYQVRVEDVEVKIIINI